ncbi:hypothetical protein NC653_039047 [Populus alba x Populus x berolinensis]|uniref:Uncharacterized protein n=1 Tax=Populus alba x Populus x berolinensis TaxID=444605 RepID=A0AAD6LBU7_9ROSI|nr:hypothetical protein NC653_039047 [Populus alba x Populus x berolinensis]
MVRNTVVLRPRHIILGPSTQSIHQISCQSTGLILQLSGIAILGSFGIAGLPMRDFRMLEQYCQNQSELKPDYSM